MLCYVMLCLVRSNDVPLQAFQVLYIANIFWDSCIALLNIKYNWVDHVSDVIVGDWNLRNWKRYINMFILTQKKEITYIIHFKTQGYLM